jgi:hypothetical protein
LEWSAPAGVEALVRAVLAVPVVHTADTDELRHALEQFRGRHAIVLERRHAVIALAGILDRRRGMLKTELLSKDEGALSSSRCLVGWWLFSARLFSPLWERCSTEGMISRWAAP